jgi:FMN reductase
VSVAIVIGNPKTNSRTLRVAVAVADALADQIPEKGDRLIVDLADVAAELFEPESQTVSDLMERVAASDIIIVASPTYKATYTGLLKSFFDRYFNNASVARLPSR